MVTAQEQVPPQIQEYLLNQSDYKCSNPACKTPVTLEKCQFDYVFQPEIIQNENLLVLCGDCHQQYRGQLILQAALQAWKILQIALAGNAEESPMDLRVGAIRNYQGLAQFFPDEHLLFPFKGGKIHLNIKESHMMLARALGIYEPDKTQTICTLLKPGMTFIDIGSNKGDFSLLAAKVVEETGKVLAFEPEPDNCHWMRRSMDVNEYRNIALYDIALGDTNEQTQLYLGEKSGWHSLIPSSISPDQDAINVQMKTLDDMLTGIDCKHVDMIKIDVEGAELKVLEGAKSTFSNNKEIILLIDIHPQLGVDPAKICNFLETHGFSIHDIKYPHGKLNHVAPDLQEILAKRL